MCIGQPLRVLEAWPGGALGVMTTGRGLCERIDTRLVGDVQPGDWLLVFQGAARERLDAQRAQEIADTLALLEAAMAGDATQAGAAAAFVLPSQMSASELAALTRGENP